MSQAHSDLVDDSNELLALDGSLHHRQERAPTAELVVLRAVDRCLDGKRVPTFTRTIRRLIGILRLLSFSRKRRRALGSGVRYQSKKGQPEFTSEDELSFMSHTLSAVPLMYHVSKLMRPFCSRAEASPKNLASLAADAIHQIKVLTAKMVWREHVEPLRKQIENMQKKYIALQDKFHEVRAEFLKEVSSLRDEVRVRGDPEMCMQRGDLKDVTFFLEPMNMLSPVEAEFALAVVKEKLKMIFEVNPAVSTTMDFGQVERLKELMVTTETSRLTEVMRNKAVEISELQTERRHLQHELACLRQSAKEKFQAFAIIESVQARSENESLKSELNNLKETHRCNSQLLKRALERIESLTLELDETRRELQQRLDVHDNMQEQLRMHREEVRRYESRDLMLTQQLEQQQNHGQFLAEENLKLRKTVERFLRRGAAKCNDDDATRETDMLQLEQVDEQAGKIQEADAEIADLKKQKRKLLSQIKQLQSENRSLIDAINEQKKQTEAQGAAAASNYSQRNISKETNMVFVKKASKTALLPDSEMMFKEVGGEGLPSMLQNVSRIDFTRDAVLSWNKDLGNGIEHLRQELASLAQLPTLDSDDDGSHSKGSRFEPPRQTTNEVTSIALNAGVILSDGDTDQTCVHVQAAVTRNHERSTKELLLLQTADMYQTYAESCPRTPGSTSHAQNSHLTFLDSRPDHVQIQQTRLEQEALGEEAAEAITRVQAKLNKLANLTIDLREMVHDCSDPTDFKLSSHSYELGAVTYSEIESPTASVLVAPVDTPLTTAPHAAVAVETANAVYELHVELDGVCEVTARVASALKKAAAETIAARKTVAFLNSQVREVEAALLSSKALQGDQNLKRCLSRVKVLHNVVAYRANKGNDSISFPLSQPIRANISKHGLQVKPSPFSSHASCMSDKDSDSETEGNHNWACQTWTPRDDVYTSSPTLLSTPVSTKRTTSDIWLEDIAVHLQDLAEQGLGQLPPAVRRSSNLCPQPSTRRNVVRATSNHENQRTARPRTGWGHSNLALPVAAGAVMPMVIRSVSPSPSPTLLPPSSLQPSAFPSRCSSPGTEYDDHSTTSRRPTHSPNPSKTKVLKVPPLHQNVNFPTISRSQSPLARRLHTPSRD